MLNLSYQKALSKNIEKNEFKIKKDLDLKSVKRLATAIKVVIVGLTVLFSLALIPVISPAILMATALFNAYGKFTKQSNPKEDKLEEKDKLEEMENAWTSIIQQNNDVKAKNEVPEEIDSNPTDEVLEKAFSESNAVLEEVGVVSKNTLDTETPKTQPVKTDDPQTVQQNFATTNPMEGVWNSVLQQNKEVETNNRLLSKLLMLTPNCEFLR